ncbi:alpha/beta-hydrolase [Aspergillus ellipticus CBS 707.79]|uniref:Carboxylic ester hydrolase n=1 Tax=Aspergillus ellipticus CBS 707.79 TaxID=1448320 RepID=A0A319DJY4_9EURO|nr:alpha/beta-hydrolase [Aspergillus ellipticus CBS 707.79]
MGNQISNPSTPHTLSLGPKGTLRGLQYANKAIRYAGIPYALPPVGPHRWRKPRPLPDNHTYTQDDGQPFDATFFRPVCPQSSFSSSSFSSAEKSQGDGDAEEKYSEDCLRLNIWTPVSPPPEGKKYPVVLWLHGGWFQLGDPLQEVGMDPTELIFGGEGGGKLNAIVVGIGYRLNVFGFLAGGALREESGRVAAGNFGLWDQRLAIEWVRRNIAAFGGDKGDVVLGGRSAGAYGVHAQVLFEFLHSKRGGKEEQFFHRFYMYSNAIPAQPKTVEEADGQFEEVCGYFGIPEDISGEEKLEKLRGVPASDLVAALSHLKNHTFRPVTDDLFVFSGFAEYHTSGAFAEEFKRRGLKVLIGEVLNEETLYATYNSPEEANLEALKVQVGNYYAPETVERILTAYELPSTERVEDWTVLFGSIIADGQVRAPSRWLVNSLHTHGVDLSDIWRYRIAYRLSFITDKVAPRAFGVSHAMDKPFWNYSIMHGPTDSERVLMQGWIKGFVAFVNNDEKFDFGTREIDQFKVATPEGKIEIQKDTRWKHLLELGDIFSGDGA